jgi:hypothetical protein
MSSSPEFEQSEQSSTAAAAAHDDLYFLDLSFSDEFSSSNLEDNIQNQVKEMDTLLMELYPTTKADLAGWEWYKGIFQTTSLTIILFIIPVLLLLLSTIFYCVNKKNKRRNGSNSSKRNNVDSSSAVDSDDITGFTSNNVTAQSRSRYSIAASRRRRQRRRRADGDVDSSLGGGTSSVVSSLGSWFKHVVWEEGLRVELSELNVKNLILHEIDIMQKSKMDNDNNSYRFHRKGKLFKILKGSSHLTEDDIRKLYPNLDSENENENESENENENENEFDDNVDGNDGNAIASSYYDSNRVVLFFRLASIFVSCGMSTIENHEILHEVSKALNLPPLSKLELGLTEINVQFSLNTPVVTIRTSTPNLPQLSLLSRSQQLAYYIIEQDRKNNQQREQLPATLYLRVLDELEQDNASDPYGWLIKIFATYIVCCFAPLAVYSGNYINLIWSSIISIAIVIALLLLQSKSILPSSVSDRWESPIVSFITGLGSSLLWQITKNGHFWQDLHPGSTLDQCVANYTIGVLLIWFPGSTLVYGAHEVCLGSYTNGGIRLIKGIVSAMVIALFYTLGWQYYGRNWASNETMNGIPTNLYNTTGR